MSADIYGFVFVLFKDTQKESLINTIKECRFEEFNQVTVWSESSYALIADYKKDDNDVSIWLPEEDALESLFEDGTNILKEFSETFSDVIAFYAIDDYYHYQHWIEGKLARILDGNDDGLNFALGNEEAWEKDCFDSVSEAEQESENLIFVDKLNRSITNFYGLRPLPFESTNKSILYLKN